MTEKKTFWGHDNETACHEAPHDAIEAEILNIPADKDGDIPPLSPGSHSVDIFEYQTVEFTDSIVDKIADDTFWELEEIVAEYMSCNGIEQSLDESVKPLLRKAVEKARECYKVRLVEFTGKTITVDAYAWCKEHHPEWVKVG